MPAPVPLGPPPQDIGHDPRKPDTRLYATHEPQPYHNDAEDIVCELPAAPRAFFKS